MALTRWGAAATWVPRLPCAASCHASIAQRCLCAWPSNGHVILPRLLTRMAPCCTCLDQPKLHGLCQRGGCALPLAAVPLLLPFPMRALRTLPPLAPLSPQVPGLVELHDPAQRRLSFLLPLEGRSDMLPF